ncbi:39S ribosomal protein L18, mitochondrial-like isoform X1 [Mercenaria mercenaria]|uniref:39S ribosomal protein L18, mitochondrial-like isoform X1 n=1 Tax=Mercenaria mercenaria TaxID=6596 RepID=UPI00234E495C|nr:39S ribosomal protein L18, mitochondrial-like isoform X1 [Mercenaria mercenaria]
MNKIVSLRLISPAFLDTSAFSCNALSRSVTCSSRCLSSSSPRNNSDNKNIKVNPLFTNRNPRALEFMGLAPKRKGWRFQAPRKDYYHRLVYDRNDTRAYIEHWTGKIVLEASSREPHLAMYLYNLHDVSANRNIGRVLARRMLEAGITSVFYDEADKDITSQRKAAFLSALKENEIQLKEPEEIQHENIPGINYDGYNRLGEKKKYQKDYQKLQKSKDYQKVEK